MNLTLDYCSENGRLRIFLKEIFNFPQQLVKTEVNFIDMYKLASFHSCLNSYLHFTVGNEGHKEGKMRPADHQKNQ